MHDDFFFFFFKNSILDCIKLILLHTNKKIANALVKLVEIDRRLVRDHAQYVL